ncbi:MAG: D-2-hydroxyacid dehydrogenase [Candidatus Binatia bacterium]
MHIAAGRSFITYVEGRARQIVPDLHWVVINGDGSTTESPEQCELLILAGDAYTSHFVDTALTIPTVRWAHTEDAGTDGRFYDTMRARGVTVTHSPGTNAREVAEFAFGCILWSAKHFATFHDNQRKHHWQLLGLDSLSDKTLLVVGLGAIGQHVATFGKAFGMRVLGIRRSTATTPNVDQQGTFTDLPQFLSAADFVVLAVPLTSETQGMIDREALAQMKPTATLVNVARGAVVDTAALKETLLNQKLRHACLDVLSTEPWPTEDDLWDVPNLFITPHNAWSSPLYLPRVGELWLENLRRYVDGKELLHRVR